MCRETLFRGKRSDDGAWVEGHLIQLQVDNFLHSIIITPSDTLDVVNEEYALAFMSSEVNVVDPDTVGQLTGLLDKNGKKIFKDDVLSLTYDGYTFNCPVEFKDGAFIVIKNNAFNGGDADMTTVGWLKHDDYRYEVVGNIHDNPDLLRKEARNE